MKKPEPKPFKLPPDQARIARRELDVYLASLCHDEQYDVQRSVTIIRILALPERISIRAAIQRLHDTLAITRSRERWGRPWTLRQLERIYFQKPATFHRRAPSPVLEEELKTYVPRVPIGFPAKAKALAAAVEVEKVKP